jgi:hypothetical protein
VVCKSSKLREFKISRLTTFKLEQLSPSTLLDYKNEASNVEGSEVNILASKKVEGVVFSSFIVI